MSGCSTHLAKIIVVGPTELLVLAGGAAVAALVFLAILCRVSKKPPR